MSESENPHPELAEKKHLRKLAELLLRSVEAMEQVAENVDTLVEIAKVLDERLTLLEDRAGLNS